MATSEALTLEYDGPAVQTGEMDVNDLAPSLLAFGNLCTEANALLNGDRATVSVRVRADFKRGSFGIEVHLLQTTIEQLKTFIGTTDVKDVKSILDTLGVMADDILKIEGVIAGPVLGLIQLAKFIGRKRVEWTERTAAGTRLRLKDNVDYLADSNAWDLYQKPNVRNDLRKFTDPLRREGFEEIRFRRHGQLVTEIDKEEADDFTAALPDDLEQSEGPLVNAVLQSRTWRVRQVAFDPNLKLWKFFQGKAPIRALMLDDDFVSRVSRHEVVFGSGDFLEVEVVVKTWASGNETYEIQKVVRVIEQPGLPLHSPPNQ